MFYQQSDTDTGCFITSQTDTDTGCFITSQTQTQDVLSPDRQTQTLDVLSPVNHERSNPGETKSIPTASENCDDWRSLGENEDE